MEIAAMKLAASAVSPILSKLGDKAAPYFGGDITDEEVKHLQNIILPKIRNLLKVAEAAPGLDELKPWLTTLQDAAYEAEDVLDKYEYKLLEAEVSSLPKPLKNLKKKVKDLLAPLALKTELKKSIEKLQKSADEADKMIPHYDINCQIPRLRDNMQSQQQQWPSTGLPPPSSVFGRDEERDLLVDMLISTTAVEHSGSRRHTPVLAICGLGGAGKTTLAQCVYNDSRVVEHFGTRMWVHVSRKFDVHKITTQIIESVTEGEGSSTITNLDALQMRLKDILNSNKFLLVLDDVWCQDCVQWDQMLAPLNEALDTAGSRILVTTRTKEVASGLGIENVVPLKDLEYEHCISIFKHYSFGDANIVIHDPEIATIAEQIMKKLKKSPLSARMVGSALRGKTVADWKWVLKKDEMLKGTLDVLYLSFDNLAPYLQRCFAFCSLYPKGHHFNEMKVNNLIRFWIAEGYVEVPKEDKMTMEDIGMQYFNELVSNSFFQKGTYGYVIHDLLHDLAEEVSKDHCFRIEDDSKDIPTTVRHLSICRKDLLWRRPLIFTTLENLRTFMITKQEYGKVDFDSNFGGRNKMFEKFKKLRVLCLGDYRSEELHKSIGKLKYLRYLQVETGRCLPESLGRLYHLQFVVLGWDNLTKKVPENMNKGEISKVPFFASRKKGHGIGQLKNLRRLRGSLRIDNLENVQDKAEASEASLKEKKFLEELTLSWARSPERDGGIDEEVIKRLEPPPNLNVLRIHGYSGIRSPEWLLNDGHFLRLSKLRISCCPKLKQVLSLPSTLKLLEVYGCENLNEMPSLPLGLRAVEISECPNLMQLSPFPPNLEKLGIDRCPGVETLLSNILLFEGEDEHPNHEQQEKDNQQHFPLKTLYIKSCSVSGKKRLFSDPNKLFTSLTTLHLQRLPWLSSLFHPDHKLTSLKSINIKDCENLAELFGSSLASSPSLRCLIIFNCPRLAMQHSQPFLLPSSLEAIEFHNCGDPEMDLLGRCLIGLSSLRRLEIGGYSHARSLPHLATPGAIEHLIVYDCPELTSLCNLQPFSSLKELHVTRCPKLIIGERLPNSLKKLRIDDCMQGIASTEEELFGQLSSLTDLDINICPNLTSLPVNIEKLSSLRMLRIYGCPKIELLPNLPSSLEALWISGCHPQLKAEYEEGGPLRHKLQHIPRVIIR